MIDVQGMPTGQLIQQYRDLMLELGADRSNTKLQRQADLFEEEMLRRMAW